MALQSAKRHLTSLRGTNAGRNLKLTKKHRQNQHRNCVFHMKSILVRQSGGCQGWSPARAGALPGLEPCQGWSPARGGALPGLEPCQGWSPDPPPPAPPPTPPPHPLALPPVLPRLDSPRPARAKTPPAKTLKKPVCYCPALGHQPGPDKNEQRFPAGFAQGKWCSLRQGNSQNRSPPTMAAPEGWVL